MQPNSVLYQFQRCIVIALFHPDFLKECTKVHISIVHILYILLTLENPFGNAFNSVKHTFCIYLFFKNVEYIFLCTLKLHWQFWSAKLGCIHINTFDIYFYITFISPLSFKEIACVHAHRCSSDPEERMCAHTPAHPLTDRASTGPSSDKVADLWPKAFMADGTSSADMQ